jgi:F-type H+-transporting ATPase subunit a
LPAYIIRIAAISTIRPVLTLTSAQLSLIIASAALVLLACGVRLFVIPHFVEAPYGWQNACEGMVEGISGFGRRMGRTAASVGAGLVRLLIRIGKFLKERVMEKKRKKPSKTVIILLGLTVVLALLEIIFAGGSGEAFEFHLVPPQTTVAGLTLSVTQLNALVSTVLLIVLAALARIFVIPKFTDEPRGLQNILEIIVEGVRDYTKGITGSWAAGSLSPYIFTLGAFIVCSGLLEYFGMRSNLTDFNSTVALAIITFLLIQVYGIAKNGVWGRLKLIGKPVAALAPIKIITDLAVPVSLASRIFGNLMGGYIVIELVYSIIAAKFAIPAFLSLYFTLFDTLMQAFIFITLSLTFIGEVVE